MMPPMKKVVLIGVPVALLVALWIFWGRFAVEGGKGEWAMINNRVDVLKDALASGMSPEKKQRAFERALGRQNVEGAKLLLAAGVNPTIGVGREDCYFNRATLATIELLLASGGDPKQCKPTRWGTMVSSLIDVNAGSASEPAFIAVFQKLHKAGVAFTPEDEKQAVQFKLPAVAAYLHAPDAAVEENHVQTLALRGTDAEVEPEDLFKVCEGEGLAKLPAYEKPAPNQVAPVFVVERYTETSYDGGSVVPGWWQSRGKLGHTQLVACARVVDKKLVKECKYEGGHSVNYYDATFDLSVREGKTGKPLATKTAVLTVKVPETCASFILGNGEGHYPELNAELTALVKPLAGVN